MKKTIAALIAIALGTVAFMTPALSWEKGTHLYIADKLKRHGDMNPMNFDEMYGAMAPDIFNYAFELPSDLYAYLHDQTHNYYYNVWKAVKWGYEKPLAFGFVSHNDKWGADFTAHWHSRTLDPGAGYIITKAGFLNTALAPYWALIEGALGEPLDNAIKIELCHNIVEAAGDIVLKRFYPELGKNLVAAGSRSDKRFKNLFLKAYLPGLMTAFGLSEDAAKAILLPAESSFRTLQVVMYGMLLQQDEDTVIDGIAAQFNSLIGGYLASKGMTLPPGSDLTFIIHEALLGAVGLIQSDYMLEVNATVNYVGTEMKRRKFWASAKKGNIF
jgi:hypothetical protein